MNTSKWLIVGLFSLATVLGYTVGASSSPVASIIIPSLFTLVTIAIGIILQKDIEKKNLFMMSRIFGIILLGMSFTYFSGSIIGANVRVSGILVFDSERKSLPWSDDSAPKDIRVAMDWIAVQEKLLSRGYSKTEIARLYKIPGAQDLKTQGILGQPQWLSDILPWGRKNTGSLEGIVEPPTIVDNYDPSDFEGQI